MKRATSPGRPGKAGDGIMDETTLREQICLFARSLFERGLTHGSSG